MHNIITRGPRLLAGPVKRSLASFLELSEIIEETPELENIPETTTLADLNLRDHLNKIYLIKDAAFREYPKPMIGIEIQNKILMTRSRINLINSIIDTKKFKFALKYILCSPSGLGKSTLLRALANELCKEDWIVFYEPDCGSFLMDTEEVAKRHLETHKSIYDRLAARKLIKPTEPLGIFWNSCEAGKRSRSFANTLVKYISALGRQPNVGTLIIMDQFNQLLHEEVKYPEIQESRDCCRYLANIGSYRPETGAVLFGLSSFEASSRTGLLRGQERSWLYNFPQLTLTETKLYLDLINGIEKLQDRKINTKAIAEKVREETTGLVRPIFEATMRYIQRLHVIDSSKDFLEDVKRAMGDVFQERINRAIKHSRVHDPFLQGPKEDIMSFYLGEKKITECHWLNSTGLLSEADTEIPSALIATLSKVLSSPPSPSDQALLRLPKGSALEARIRISMIGKPTITLPIARGSSLECLRKCPVENVVDLPNEISEGKGPLLKKIKKRSFVFTKGDQKAVDAFYYGDSEIFFFSISAQNYTKWIGNKSFPGFPYGACSTVYNWVRANVEDGNSLPELMDLNTLPRTTIQKITKGKESSRVVFPAEFLKKVHFVHLTTAESQAKLEIHEDEIMTIKGEEMLTYYGLLREHLRKDFNKYVEESKKTIAQ